MTFREPPSTRSPHRRARQIDDALQRNMSPSDPVRELCLSMDIQKPHTPVAVPTPDCEECIPDAPRMVTPGDAARAGLRAILLSTGDGDVRVHRHLQKRRHWALPREVR
jgi:hypothetical protein